jgi:hypothetical protein
MEKYGVDASKMVERGRKREREDPRVRRRAERSAATDKEMEDAAANDSDEEMEGGRGLSKGAKKECEQSVERKKRQSRPREPSQMGLKDESVAKIAKKVVHLQGYSAQKTAVGICASSFGGRSA